MNKDMQQLVALLQKHGYTVRHTKKQHYAVNKDGGPTIFMPCTPSDKRGILRVHQKLRSIGFDIRQLR